MNIRTETSDRAVPAQQAGTGLSMLAATLPAADPLLAAMAFSKGRFAVETQGLATLYIPSWPEVTRVIEDCRLIHVIAATKRPAKHGPQRSILTWEKFFSRLVFPGPLTHILK